MWIFCSVWDTKLSMHNENEAVEAHYIVILIALRGQKSIFYVLILEVTFSAIDSSETCKIDDLQVLFNLHWTIDVNGNI